MSSACVQNVAIIGGGIGGLTCALALSRVGVSAHVYEQAPVLGEVGAGLGLWCNAVRPLERLGLGATLREIGGPIRVGRIMSSSGRVLQNLPMDRLLERYGGKNYLLHRGELHRVLRDALEASAIRTSARCTSVRFEAGQPTAHFEDGSSVQAELIIGADGIQSRVRASLWGESPPRYAGEICWRMIANAPELSEPGVLTEIQGPGCRAGVCPLDERRIYCFLTQAKPEGMPRPAGGWRPYLLEHFAGWPLGVQAILQACDESQILRNDIYDRPPLSRWRQGAITLLGDAAHPTTPNLGMGACMAIEDAVVLARLLSAHTSLPEALAAYEAERREFCNRTVVQSRQFGMMAQASHPWLVAMREWMLSRTPESVVHRQWGRMWGYEVGLLPGQEA